MAVRACRLSTPHSQQEESAPDDKAKGEVRDDRFVRDSGPARYRRQQSRPSGLAESPKVLTEFLHSIVDRNSTLRQQGLKRKLAHFRQTARLCESQPFLLEQCQDKLPLQFGLAK